MMKRLGVSVCVLASFAALSLPCVAQDNPWNGSWKLDPHTIKYNGPTFSVQTDADGFTITRDGKASPKMVCNGESQSDPTGGGMTTCTKTETGYEISSSKDGKPTNKVTLTLAGNGKSMHRKIEVFPPEGSPYTMTNTATRVSGGPGFAGVWKVGLMEESQDTGLLAIQVHEDSVDFKETDNDKPITCKLDGTPTQFPTGGTMQVKQDGPHTLKVTYRDEKGEIRRENTFVLSPNGKTVRETDVTPEPSPSTETMLLRKM